jgi:tyrosine-protein phosphatase YwqE
MTSLDIYFKKKFGYIPCIDLIKIDIEGGEFFAIKGMQDIIKCNEDITICMEFNTKYLGRNKSKLIHQLLKYGFYPYIYYNNNLQEINPNELLIKNYEINLIFKKN